MDPLIVSYSTLDSLYEEEIKDLILSCKSLNLEYSIDNINTFGSWEKNCCYKPKFILEKLLTYKKPLLWVDADAIIIKKPIIDNFLNDDFAFRFKYDEKNNKKSIRSGTIFINFTNQAINFLKAWDLECQKELNDQNKMHEVWDERCLFKLIHDGKLKISFSELSIGYCKIFDKYNDKVDDENTYILQFQASRVYKNFINNNIEVPVFLRDLPPMELKKMRFKK